MSIIHKPIIVEVNVPPYIFQPETMFPLFVAYDQRLHDSDSQLKTYKELAEQLQQQVTVLVKENEEMHDKLKQNILTAIKKSETDSLTAEQSHAMVSNYDWREAQERIELLDKENKILIQEQQELQREIGKLREDGGKLNDACMWEFWFY